LDRISNKGQGQFHIHGIIHLNVSLVGHFEAVAEADSNLVAEVVDSSLVAAEVVEQVVDSNLVVAGVVEQVEGLVVELVLVEQEVYEQGQLDEGESVFFQLLVKI
jgi:hypothetical protein